MTVAELAPVESYLENGVTLAFPVPWRFLPHTLTASRVLADGTTVALAEGPDFSATGGDTDAGGTLTLASSVAGATLFIGRDTPVSQEMDYDTADTFPAESHEDALDKLTLIAQEQGAGLHDISGRALRVPAGETVPPFPPADIRKQSIAGFDGLGNPALFPADSLGSIAVIAQRAEYEATAGQTTFATFAPYIVGYVSVFVNGAKLSTADFTATDGSNVVLALGCEAGDVVSVEAFLGSSVAGDAVGIRYSEGGSGAVEQSVQEAIRRERLNLYDRIPKALWPAIEAGTNTADLTPYVASALATGRGVNVPPGRFRMGLTVNQTSRGASLRGEGRHLTTLENLDNRAIIKLDSSAAHIVGFELEDMWLENRDPAAFSACDLLVITGAGDGEAFQNDMHHFRRLWFYQGRDNITVANRCIWPVWDDIKSTGALRDAFHVEVAANVNQWSLRDCILKGAGRFGLLFLHNFADLATGWTLDNISTEDCNRGGWRFAGTGGFQGFGARQCTFENNALGVAVGSSAVVDGIRQRKTSVFADCPNIVGLDFNGDTFYGAVAAADRPDWHIYVESAGSVLISGEIANSRFSVPQPTGGDVAWGPGLFYHASNVNSGVVSLDRNAGSIDQRDAQTSTAIVPTLRFGGASVGIGYSNQRGRWALNGRVVTFEIYLGLNNKGSSVGNAQIAGLPIPAFNSTNLIATFAASYDGVAIAAGSVMSVRVSPNAQVLDLYVTNGGGMVPMTNAEFGNFSAISITGSYLI